MLPDNSWYGHRKILFQYLGLKDRTIFASLQHGWCSQVLDKTANYKKSYFYKILVWSKFQSKFFLKKKIKNVYDIGSPFLYLCKLLETNQLKEKINSRKEKKILVFPAHSSQGFNHITDHKLLIKNVKKSFKGKYTVCFYYFDLNKKDIDLYKKNKWEVICCVKNKTDQLSLYKLYNQINNHDIIVSTEFSSALFYSMYLKKKTRVMLSPNKRLELYSNLERKFLKFYMNNYPELFKKFLSSEKGYKLGKLELGFVSMKNKHDLKEILGLNSFIKMFFANVFSFIYDLKYGSGLRKGKNLNNKNLKKYILAARKKSGLY